MIVAVEGLGPSVCAQTLARPRLAALVAQGCRGLDTGAGGSASAWATLVTGTSPGQHGVFADGAVTFQAPDPAAGQRQWGVGPRRGAPFWVTTTGVPRSVILGVPHDFPPTPARGVTQVVGAVLPGPWAVDGPAFAVGARGVAQVLEVSAVASPRGSVLALPVGAPSLALEPAVLEVADGQIRQQAPASASVALEVGGWSEPLRIDVQGPGGRQAWGWTRIWTHGLDPLTLVLQPLSADAGTPWLPLSHPTAAALELQQRVGRARTSAHYGDRAAVAAGLLPWEALEGDLLEAVDLRTEQAVWALSHWDAALVLFGVPELAELLGRPDRADRGLDRIEAALDQVAVAAPDAELTLVSVRGLSIADELLDPGDLLGQEAALLTLGAHGAVRIRSGIPPARGVAALERLGRALEQDARVARLERRTDWPGARAGLAPDLRIIPISGLGIGPEPWVEEQGVVLGVHADADGPGLAGLGSAILSRLVSE